MPFIENQAEFNARQACSKTWDARYHTWRYSNGAAWNVGWKQGSEPPTDDIALTQAKMAYWRLVLAQRRREAESHKSAVDNQFRLYKRYANVPPPMQGDVAIAKQLQQREAEAEEEVAELEAELERISPHKQQQQIAAETRAREIQKAETIRKQVLNGEFDIEV